MYKFILILFLIVSVSVKAQIKPGSIFDNSQKDSKEQINLLNTMRSADVNPEVKINTEDFIFKGQKGLNFMSPGSALINLRCEKVTDWSVSISNALDLYFKDLRKDYLDKMAQGTIESVVSEFRDKNCKFAILSWDITNYSESKSINSVAVIDESGNILFDTELVKFITGVREFETSQTEFAEDSGTPNSVSTIVNQRSGTMSFSYWVDGTFGSVRHYNYVRATAIVPPYITAATNDAFFNSQTTDITSERRDAETFSPPTEPCIYFGTGGSIANSYSSAVPFSSRVYLSNTNDHFNDGGI